MKPMPKHGESDAQRINKARKGLFYCRHLKGGGYPRRLDQG